MSTSLRPSQVEFAVEVVTGAHETVVDVSGEIDLATCERLRAAIEPHLGPVQHVVLDLAGVHFMDASSLGVLLSARARLRSDGGSLSLRNPSLAARTLLSATGLTDSF